MALKRHCERYCSGIHEMSFTIPFRNLNCRSDWGGISSQGASCGIIYLKNISPNIKGRLKGFLRFLKEVPTTRHQHKGGGECDHATLHKCLGWTHLRGAISYQGISHQGSVPVHQIQNTDLLQQLKFIHTNVLVMLLCTWLLSYLSIKCKCQSKLK